MPRACVTVSRGPVGFNISSESASSFSSEDTRNVQVLHGVLYKVRPCRRNPSIERNLSTKLHAAGETNPGGGSGVTEQSTLKCGAMIFSAVAARRDQPSSSM